jgi:hypothetical protein
MIGGLFGSAEGLSNTGGAAGDATATGGVSSGNISVGFNVPEWSGKSGINIEKLIMIGAGALIVMMLIRSR